MSDRYDPRKIEQGLYRRWEEAGYFRPEDERGGKQSWCTLTPPLNVTGSLHMGHAFQHTLLDILNRHRRMQGDDVLWQTGTDHAGISTQMLVERQLEAEGIKRMDLGREAFIEKIWQWRNTSSNQIEHQMRCMGSSVDWSSARFTMDPDYSHAVTQAFIRLFKEGLIYKGKRLVNWDPVLQTAISDLEVENREEQGHLWYLRYPLAGAAKTENGEDYLVVATTRPETMLGDTAVAVHPDDSRYRHLIGQQVRLPVTHRLVPVLADNYVDPAFGTGCLKITPAHDMNDYEVGQRHGLPMINVLTAKAAINDNAPQAYRGLDRFEARKAIVAQLQEEGYLERIEPHTLTIPRGDRSGAVLEPWLTYQWFVEMTPLAEPAIRAVQEGRVKFVPKNYENIYFAWLRNIKDWCISRQQWWGHRIPVWYDPDQNIYVGMSESEVRASHQLSETLPLRQEEDVLETWFSSALWSFASLGWPNQPDRVDRYHPTDVLVTGHDIIFFWVARMIMLSLKLCAELPFREVYVHGLIRDAEGRKMSKSQGNGLDPLDLVEGIDLDSLVAKRTANLMQPKMAQRIERDTRRDFPKGIPAFGTDALRFTFCALATQGRNIPFDLQRAVGYQHFCNKLWNAAHFVFSNTADENYSYQNTDALELDLVDHWILERFRQCLEESQEAIRTYRFDLLARSLYEFVWHEYCDWYLEFVKPVLSDPNTQAARLRGVRGRLIEVLEMTLRALHPIMPFITETLWLQCAKRMGLTGDSIMLQPYPQAKGDDEAGQRMIDESEKAQALQSIHWLKQVVIGIRTIRSELQVPPGKRITILFQGGQEQDQRQARQTEVYLKRLARVSDIQWLSESDSPPPASVRLIGHLKLLVPLADLVEKEAEMARLQKEIEKKEAELAQTNKHLANQNFIAKAPPEVVSQKRQKVEELQSAINELKNSLSLWKETNQI